MATFHPWCTVCGWRQGGRDSWDGLACKCKVSAPPLAVLSAWNVFVVRNGTDYFLGQVREYTEEWAKDAARIVWGVPKHPAAYTERNYTRVILVGDEVKVVRAA